MRALGEAAGDRLLWIGTRALHHEYQLRSAGDLYATLRIEGWARRRISAESSDGSWDMRPRGFLGREIEIVETPAEREVARYRASWLGGGTLTFTGDRSFSWRRLGFWSGEWGFTGTDGEPLVRIRSEPSLFRARARLTVAEWARAVPGLATMAVLGFYLLLQRRRAAAS